MRLLIRFALMHCLAIIPVAHAGTLATCRSEATGAKSRCDDAVTKAQAFKKQESDSATTASSSQGMSTNAFMLSAVTSDGASADLQAEQYCSDQKGQCDSPCEGVTPTSMQAQANSVKSDCEKHIAAQIQVLTQSAQNLTGNSGDANNTGQQSQSSQTPSVSPSSGTSTSSDTSSGTADTSGTATTNAATTTQSTATFQNSLCSTDSSYLYDKCASELESRCNGHFTSTAICENFSNRYCNTSYSSSEASSGALPAGEGSGSSYCLAYQGKSDTSSTQSSSTSSPSQTSSNSGKGSGGSGPSAGATHSPDASSADGKKTDAQTSSLHVASMDISSSGGGSASSGGNHESISPGQAYSSSHKSSVSAGTVPASVKATDIAKQTQSIFSISTEILLKRCLYGKLLHCEPKK